VDGYTVDPALLQRLGRSLRSSGESLDALGKSVPGTPDAGELSADMAKAIGLLAEAAGELSVRLCAAGDAVARGGSVYADAEDTVQASIPNAE
jgi:hypothetical protein